MSRENDAPFPRGTTYYQGRTIDTSNYEGTELEGIRRTFEDIDLSAAGAKTRRTARDVVCQLMRNTCGITLLPGDLVTCSTANPPRVNGNADSAADARCVLVDEYLPSTGVPNGDLFWAVIRGPGMAKTPPVAGGFSATIAAGDVLVAATGSAASTAAAATTNDNASVAKQVFAAPTDAGSTATFVAQLNNRIGVAMSARTTAETNSDILVDMNVVWLPPEA